MKSLASCVASIIHDQCTVDLYDCSELVGAVNHLVTGSFGILTQ